MVLRFGVKAVRSAVLEGHILQLALAAGIAHWAIEWMVAQQHLQRGFTGLCDLRRLGLDDHAFDDRSGARGL